MASTNKTANLNLNQWAASDPVLREDFNADNAALDAAYAAIPYVKLRETAATQSAMALEFDLSDIDLDKYSELRLLLTLKCTSGSNTSNLAYVYFNKTSFDSTHKSSHIAIENNPLWVQDAGIYIYTPYYSEHPPVMTDIRMNVSPPGSNGLRMFTGTLRSAHFQTSNVSLRDVTFAIYSGQLSKLILQKNSTTDPASQPFAAGTKIQIYGVKK